MNKRKYLITAFGAEANSSKLQTEKIQAAIDACFESGGGYIVIPEGTFLTGGIRLRSNCTCIWNRGQCLKTADIA